MSSKIRSLRKKLKEKEEHNNPENKEVTNITTSKLNPKLDSTKRKVLFKPPTKRRDSYIDPLEYFKKEHEITKDDINNTLLNEIFAEDEKEDESEKEEEQEKKTQKPRPKPKGGMMMMGMPMPMGGMPGAGFKINFEEMMKARAKVKKQPQPEKKSERATSVKDTNAQKKKEIEEEDNDAEPQIKQGHEQSLYIKLVLARNKYNELSSNKGSVYKKILGQIDELRHINDFPPEYLEKVDEYEEKLKVPERLILDPDVQVIEDNSENEKIIKEPISLDDIITSLNLGEN